MEGGKSDNPDKRQTKDSNHIWHWAGVEPSGDIGGR